jgi:hypothetical protein
MQRQQSRLSLVDWRQPSATGTAKATDDGGMTLDDAIILVARCRHAVKTCPLSDEVNRSNASLKQLESFRIFSPSDLVDRLGVHLLNDQVLDAFQSCLREIAGLETDELVDKNVEAWYEAEFQHTKSAEWYQFMNHGYAPLCEEAKNFPNLTEHEDMWRHQAYQYIRLLEWSRSFLPKPSLRGLSLLDVGCGRGGGVSVMKRHYQLGRTVGLDQSTAQIDFCRRTLCGFWC